jgi:hypothetical protein
MKTIYIMLVLFNGLLIASQSKWYMPESELSPAVQAIADRHEKALN